MKRTKKQALLMFVIMLVFSMTLAACGGSEGSTSTEHNSGAANQGNAAESNDQAASNVETAVDPAKLDPYTVKLYVPGAPQADEAKVEEEINKYLKEKINASLDINFLDWGPWFEKMPVMMASGEEFDIKLTAAWNNYHSDVAKGAFIPLDELIDQYAPNTKATWNPAYFDAVRVKGKIYGIPANKEMAEQRGWVFRKDLIDKYKIDLSTVKTPADVEPILETIKKNEPNIVPFYNMNANGIRNMTMREAVANFTGVYDYDKGQFVYVNDDPSMLEDYKLAHKWYKLGYINQDASTTKEMDQQIKAGNVFSFENGYKPNKEAEMAQTYGHEWVYVTFGEPMITTNSAAGSMLAISRTSKNPERAMMFLELLNSDKYLNNLVNFGIEGVHYTKVSDNVIKAADNSAYKPNAGWMFGNQMLNYLWDNEDPQKWEKYEAFNKTAKVSPIVGFNFDTEPVKNEIAAVKNIEDQYATALAVGAVDPEKFLPEVSKKEKAQGVEKIIEEANKQLEQWKADNNK